MNKSKKYEKFKKTFSYKFVNLCIKFLFGMRCKYGILNKKYDIIKRGLKNIRENFRALFSLRMIGSSKFFLHKENEKKVKKWRKLLQKIV